MKRCVAELTEGYVNIHADRLELNREDSMIYAWNGAELAGAFDLSVVLKIYISEKHLKGGDASG